MADEGYLVDTLSDESGTKGGILDTHLCYFCTVYFEIAVGVGLVAVMVSLMESCGWRGDSRIDDLLDCDRS